ncbi:hypothetical protein GRX03_00900 [Halovenus sp. WSH3]|uniref:Uncharacterized protein n=1 Tax=Halovenus carboxidivorans TaxID=2692199 RepID=A0A6B0SWU9_9EURY|nr:hypothetical protein [Halovenus carboxidivorans]MXR50168.1 hypothetical protein [Halovenus carboxidivorans]
MDRRTFVSGLCCAFAGGVAGCLGSDDEETPDDGPSASGDHREVRIRADNLTRQADNRIVENGQVSIILRLKNIGTEPEYADISLQMRDREGNDLGSEYTRQHGPIAPDEIAEIRFNVDEAESEIGGYELVVREGEPPDSDEGTGNETAG